MKLHYGQKQFELFGEYVSLERLAELPAGEYSLNITQQPPEVSECNRGDYVIDDHSVQFSFTQCSIDFYVCPVDGSYHKYKMVLDVCGQLYLFLEDTILFSWTILAWDESDYPACKSDALTELRDRIIKLMEVYYG